MHRPRITVGRLSAATASRPPVRQPSRAPSRSGYTLLELLLAITIAVIVISILYAVFHVVIQSTEIGQRRRSVMGRATEAVDTLSRDLQSAYASDVETNCAFSLHDRSASGARDAVLEFCATLAPDSEPDPRWYDVVHLRYERIREGAEDRLVRIHHVVGRIGDDGAFTNVVARFVTGWNVEVYDGETWVASWPNGDTPVLPQAARIRLSIVQDGDQLDLPATVFIPAGNGAEMPTGAETNRQDAATGPGG